MYCLRFLKLYLMFENQLKSSSCLSPYDYEKTFKFSNNQTWVQIYDEFCSIAFVMDSICSKPGKWAVMYVCAKGIILAFSTILFLILELFRQRGMFCFLFYQYEIIQLITVFRFKTKSLITVWIFYNFNIWILNFFPTMVGFFRGFFPVLLRDGGILIGALYISFK